MTNFLNIILILSILLVSIETNYSKERSKVLPLETKTKPTFHVAKGLNKDGSLLKYYKRGLDYAIDYFGNYGPYHIYLFGPETKRAFVQFLGTEQRVELILMLKKRKMSRLKNF